MSDTSPIKDVVALAEKLGRHSERARIIAEVSRRVALPETSPEVARALYDLMSVLRAPDPEPLYVERRDEAPPGGPC